MPRSAVRHIDSSQARLSMTRVQLELRQAYESAAAQHRSMYERYYPLDILGARPPLQVTPASTAELERLAHARDVARAAYAASRT